MWFIDGSKWEERDSEVESRREVRVKVIGRRKILGEQVSRFNEVCTIVETSQATFNLYGRWRAIFPYKVPKRMKI